MSTLHIKLFAQAREAVGREFIEVDVSHPATVLAVRTRIASDHPQLAQLLSRSALAVNRRYAGDSEPVRQGDEVAMIPPVAGG